MPIHRPQRSGSMVGVALLLVIRLRAKTRRWIALMFATLVVLFGDGQSNIPIRVTSITNVGFAIPFDLVALLLGDHEGPLDHRDWIALGALLGALLSSLIALTLVFTVGMTVALWPHFADEVRVRPE